MAELTKSFTDLSTLWYKSLIYFRSSACITAVPQEYYIKTTVSKYPVCSWQNMLTNAKDNTIISLFVILSKQYVRHVYIYIGLF